MKDIETRYRGEERIMGAAKVHPRVMVQLMLDALLRLLKIF
ncbi:hypothetical protein JMUB7487_27420 [Staphylococcus aureus]